MVASCTNFHPPLPLIFPLPPHPPPRHSCHGLCYTAPVSRAAVAAGKGHPQLPSTALYALAARPTPSKALYILADNTPSDAFYFSAQRMPSDALHIWLKHAI
eukprot:360671-Chlamydomonas_euryale.AAC.1